MNPLTMRDSLEVLEQGVRGIDDEGIPADVTDLRILIERIKNVHEIARNMASELSADPPVLGFSLRDTMDLGIMVEGLITDCQIVQERVEAEWRERTVLDTSRAYHWLNEAYPQIAKALPDLTELLKYEHDYYNWTESKSLLAALLKSSVCGSFDSKGIAKYIRINHEEINTRSMAVMVSNATMCSGWEILESVFLGITLLIT